MIISNLKKTKNLNKISMEKEILMKNGKYTTQDIEFKTTSL